MFNFLKIFKLIILNILFGLTIFIITHFFIACINIIEYPQRFNNLINLVIN